MLKMSTWDRFPYLTKSIFLLTGALSLHFLHYTNRVLLDDCVQVCRTCNSSGMDCGIVSNEPGPGIEGADFIFYVSAMETERCHKGLTVAYAAHCQQEAALDRWEWVKKVWRHRFGIHFGEVSKKRQNLSCVSWGSPSPMPHKYYTLGHIFYYFSKAS